VLAPSKPHCMLTAMANESEKRLLALFPKRRPELPKAYREIYVESTSGPGPHEQRSGVATENS
jgi:hypothetical protein